MLVAEIDRAEPGTYTELWKLPARGQAARIRRVFEEISSWNSQSS
jgi:hypothetical protein